MLLFQNNDESDDSEEDNLEAPAAGPAKIGLQDQAPQLESNEGSSIRAPSSTVTNGGRPQRKSKSKKKFFFSRSFLTELPSQPGAYNDLCESL